MIRLNFVLVKAVSPPGSATAVQNNTAHIRSPHPALITPVKKSLGHRFPFEHLLIRQQPRA